jgi:hypothetical protein
MITKLRRLWYLLDANDIHFRPRYFGSATSTWEDALSHELDIED